MNIDIQKIVKTITRKNRGLQDPQLIYPARDWAIGMVGTLAVVCGALGFSVWQYQSYTNLSLDEEVVLSMIPYKTTQVEEALVRYRQLVTIHDEIVTKAEIIISTEDENGTESEDEGGVENDTENTDEAVLDINYNPAPETSTNPNLSI